MSRLLSEADWKAQEEMDTERAQLPVLNSLLYRVWNEKTNMMKMASVQNGFKEYKPWLSKS